MIDARACKEAKYATDLLDKIEENGFMADLVTVEVGACGFVRYDSFRRLNNLLGASQKDLLNFLGRSPSSPSRTLHIWILRNCWSDHSEAIISVWLSLSFIKIFNLYMLLLNGYLLL